MSAPTNTQQLQIITADQRMQERRGIKGVLTGISGIGKTSQLWTLNPQTTLFLNLEAGELAVQGWPGDEIRIRDWERARDLACWIGGANPAMRDDQSYSRSDFARVCNQFGPPTMLDKYETVFVDSITVASRLCLQWAKGQPQAMSDRNGKADMRGAYGLLGQEMIGWLTHLQHEGAKTGLELPGIVDEILTLADIRPAEGAPYRAFVCTTLNEFGFPAKDRSGRLAPVEPAHLGRLMEKIRGPLADSSVARLNFELPAAVPTTPNTGA
jgi:hypothetical protein